MRPSAAWSLPQYQEWFAKEHPDLPPAVRPQDPPGAVWTMQSLESLFSGLHLTSEQGVQGPMILRRRVAQSVIGGAIWEARPVPT